MIDQRFIRKVGRSWLVYSKAGKVLGRHTSEEDAQKQLGAIEASKHASREDISMTIGEQWATRIADAFAGRKLKDGDLSNMQLPPPSSMSSEGYPLVPSIPMDKQPNYPFGLCLTLTEESIAKLGLIELPAPGTRVNVLGKGIVQRVEMDATLKGEKRRRIELQLTDLALETTIETLKAAPEIEEQLETIAARFNDNHGEDGKFSSGDGGGGGSKSEGEKEPSAAKARENAKGHKALAKQHYKELVKHTTARDNEKDEKYSMLHDKIAGIHNDLEEAHNEHYDLLKDYATEKGAKDSGKYGASTDEAVSEMKKLISSNSRKIDGLNSELNSLKSRLP